MILKKLPNHKAPTLKKRIRVLHVPTSGVNAGGITKFIIDTMTIMVGKEELDCHLVSPKGVTEAFEATLTDSQLSLQVIAGRAKNPIAYFFRLWSYMRQHDFDSVHIHGSSALMSLELLAARLSGIKVRIAHSHNITCDHPFLHRLLTPFFRRLYTHALACSHDAGKWLFADDDFTVIYNGINRQRFSFSADDRSDIRRSLGLTEENLLLGHVGHFNTQKNHQFLIDIFQRIEQEHPEARLLLIGTGKLEEDIREKVGRLHLSQKVFFLGNVSDVYRYLSVMDVFVLPSLFEGFSIVLAEAQANALPAITSHHTPKTVALTSKVQYLGLDEGTDVWASEIMKQSSKDRRLSKEEERQLAVFDIETISNTLYHYYVAGLLETIKERS